EDLPQARHVEMRAMRTRAQNREVIDAVEPRDIEAAELHGIEDDQINDPPLAEGPIMTPDETAPDEDPTIFEAISQGPNLQHHARETQGFLDKVKIGYSKDPLFKKVLNNVAHHPSFRQEDGLIYTSNRADEDVLCIPRIVNLMESLTGTVIEMAHSTLGHFGPQRTSDYIRRWFWW
ncbi:hypothetical protein FIBSPDRAFT_704358, partial [Athelia psychrophila]